MPQGGVLSGILANLYLFPFDRWVVGELTDTFGIRYVRYADDFIIVAPQGVNRNAVESAVSERLGSDEFRLETNPSKSEWVDLDYKRLKFVGFSLDVGSVRIAEKNIRKFKMRMDKEVFDAFESDAAPEIGENVKDLVDRIIWKINNRITGFRGEEDCPNCGCERVGPARSWVSFFKIVTSDRQLAELDRWIRRRIYRFIYSKSGKRIKRKDLKRKGGDGLQSLVNERYSVLTLRRRPCFCDLKESGHDLWKYRRGLFAAGGPYSTLGQRRPFWIAHLDRIQIQVSVGERQYKIERKTLEQLWRRLVSGETLMRAKLEAEGVRNSSQVVALLEKLPGVRVLHSPSLGLRLDVSQPSAFHGSPGEEDDGRA